MRENLLFARPSVLLLFTKPVIDRLGPEAQGPPEADMRDSLLAGELVDVVDPQLKPVGNIFGA